MGRAPCCDKANVKKGPWSPEEDAQLKDYIGRHGTGGNWIALPQKAGLKRCGKSCRLRWLNYLRPNIKHGEFSEEEDRIICSLYVTIGSRWSIIAAQLPGRTDNDIKNYWNTKLKKKLMIMANNNHHLQKSQLSHHKMKSNNTGYNPMLHQMNSPSSQSQLMPSPAPSSSPPPPPYHSGDNYYNTLSSSALSFTGFDQSALLGNSSNRLCASPSAFLNPNYLVFGGAPEPSCSSSDDIKYDQFYNGSSLEDEDQKMGLLAPGIWEETLTAPLMDYGLEEIKQLISTTTSNGDFNNCSSFNFDENKKEVLYY